MFMNGEKPLRLREGLSETELAEKSRVSRQTLRAVEGREESVTLSNFAKINTTLDRRIVLLSVPTEECYSDCSTIAVAMKVMRDGESSWKGHFFELVDEFRKALDPRLILLPPPQSLSLQLKGLLASMVLVLSDEAGIEAPEWAKKNLFLERPWFPSEMESLKASAVLESPLFFRKNNIFVQSNFMQRV